MRFVKNIFTALLMAGSIAIAGSAAQAQSTTRDAAIAMCVKVAQAAHSGDSEAIQQQRTAAYKACMTKAGHAP